MFYLSLGKFVLHADILKKLTNFLRGYFFAPFIKKTRKNSGKRLVLMIFFQAIFSSLKNTADKSTSFEP